MMESLKCPECSAPLQRPAGATQTLQCPYCHCSVMLDRAIVEPRRELHAVYLPDMTVVAKSRWPSRVWWFVAGIAAVVIGFPVVMSLMVFGVRQHVKNTTFTPIPPINFTPSVILPSIVTTPATPTFAKQIMKFGSQGVGAGQFQDTRSIAVDGGGHIYVGEAFGGRVQVFDAAGHFLKVWMVDPKHLLANLAATREGTVLALSAGIVQRYDGLTGKPLGELNTLNADGQRVYFNDICVALSGDLYALDQESKIWILNAAGQVQRTLNGKQITQDEELSLERIAISGDGRIYAINRPPGIVQFTPQGRFENRFAMADEANPIDRRPETLHMSMNLAVDGQGRVIVADLNPALKVFDRNGRFLGSFGENEVCFGVAVNDTDEIISCFRNAHEIRKYQLIGK